MNEEVDYKRAFHLMCSYYASIMEGDTHRIDDAFKLMAEHNIDEYGYPMDEDIDEIQLELPKKPI